MIIQDRLYGEITFEEPIILDLINSPSLQRLKKISQQGYFEPYFPNTFHSRLEHSIGVWWLLRTNGASIAEQVAGLIHDVSHSAFSHCIDYILDAGSHDKHDYQDNIFTEYVLSTEIPNIIQCYGLDLDYILDDSHFPLLESSLPDLCADRIDYALRDALAFGEISVSSACQTLSKLRFISGKWIFLDFTNAKNFAELFRLLNSKYYSGFPTAVMHYTVGACIRYAISKGIVTPQDLYVDDEFVLEKVRAKISEDSRLAKLYQQMNSGNSFISVPKNKDIKVVTKSRGIDPSFMDDGVVRTLSSVDVVWKDFLSKENTAKEYYLLCSNDCK